MYDLKKEKFNTTVRHSPKNENKKIEVDSEEYKDKNLSKIKSEKKNNSQNVIFGLHEKFIFTIKIFCRMTYSKIGIIANFNNWTSSSFTPNKR